jgi:hypothetical protein
MVRTNSDERNVNIESYKKYQDLKKYQSLNFGMNASKARPKKSVEGDKYKPIFENRK